jgi:hypothetical protein
MCNLDVLTKLYSPKKLANILDRYFLQNPGAFDLFCATLSNSDRREFLGASCENLSLQFFGDEKRDGGDKDAEIKRTLVVTLYKLSMTNDNVDHVFLVLRAAAHSIPNDKSYLKLKEYTLKEGVASLATQGANHRVRCDEAQGLWLLEEFVERKPDDVVTKNIQSKAEVKPKGEKRKKREGEWKPIVRG